MSQKYTYGVCAQLIPSAQVASTWPVCHHIVIPGAFPRLPFIWVSMDAVQQFLEVEYVLYTLNMSVLANETTSFTIGDRHVRAQVI